MAFVFGAAVFGVITGAIGLVPGTLSILQFADKVNLDKAAPYTAHMRVAVGLDRDGGLDGSGGDLPDARLFNQYGEFLGIAADPGDVGSGTGADLAVEQSHAQQAYYTLFTANNDAICVAYAYMIWAGESAGSQYGFVGSFGRECGVPWYYSGMVIPGSGNYTPSCFWIDANGDQPTTGFQVNWVDMAANDPSMEGQDASRFCNSPSFNTYTEKEPKAITYWTPTDGQKHRLRRHSAGAAVVSVSKDAPPARRLVAEGGTPQTVQERFENVLVVDDLPEHTAEALCASETSSGPDFVNVASVGGGGFCDMKTKTLYPLCEQDSNSSSKRRAKRSSKCTTASTANSTGSYGGNGTAAAAAGVCFDLESKSLSGPGVRRRQAPYTVQNWGEQRTQNRKRDVNHLAWDLVI